jgi:predicted porin
MKKTLIALAAVAVSSAAMAQVTVYGIVDTGYQWSKSEDSAGVNLANTAGLKTGTMSGSRLGFRGVEELEGGMKAGFQYEMGVDASNGAILANGTTDQGFGRVAQAYVEGGFGKVSIGRHLLPSYLAATAFDATGASSDHEVVDLYPNGVRSNGLWYANKFGPVAVNAFMTTGKSGKDSAGNKARGYDVSATYAAGPLTIAAALTSQKTELAAVTGVQGTVGSPTVAPVANVVGAAAKETTVTGNAIGAAYDLGMAKVMVNMVSQKSKNNVNGEVTKVAETNVGVTVPMGKITLMAAYGIDKDTDKDGNSDKANDYTIGVSYALSKRTNVFAFMSEDKNSDERAKPSTSTREIAGDKTKTTTVGLRHSF